MIKLGSFLQRDNKSSTAGSGGYISAEATVREAKKLNLSVCDYVEKLWDQQGATANVIEKILDYVQSRDLNHIVEIGPGTGRYTEKLLQQVEAKQYEIYEVAKDWNDYLQSTYGDKIIAQQADGISLNHTQANSCELVHAHGVFVYLGYIHAFRYFSEMCRVCAHGGYVMFDYYSQHEMDLQIIERCIATNNDYAMVLHEGTVNAYFNSKGFTLLGDFLNRHGQGYSRYVIYQKNGQHG